MQSHLQNRKGMTLIETLLYIALLTMLVLSFLRYLYSINDINMNLYDDIQKAYEE